MDRNDLVEYLVLEDLKESYKSVLDIDPSDIKLLKALNRVIKLYSTLDQYKNWKEYQI